jgi:hypothetical protein
MVSHGTRVSDGSRGEYRSATTTIHVGNMQLNT